jgi:hypothetical protein
MIVKFNPKHLKHIQVQEAQKHVATLLESPEYHDLLMTGEAYTVIENGEILCCAGVFPITDYMGRAWAIMSKHSGVTMLLLTRSIIRFLKKSDYVRIDTPVRRGFRNGHRWCKAIGFINETPENGMKYYGFDGDTYDLYAIYPKEIRDHGRLKPFQKA